MKLNIKISIIIIILLGLAFYNYFYHSPEYFKNMRAENPNWNISYLIVKSIDSTSFQAENQTDKIVAINYKNILENGDSLAIGNQISIKSYHIGADTVIPSFIHIHKGRTWKIYLSIIPVIIIFTLIFKYFKFDKMKRRIIIK
jgi:hypothetical protein